MLDVTCFGINAIVGSSIYLFPGRLAELLGPASILSFGLTALLLSPVALCFAQAASLFNSHGGPYLYARKAMGPAVGYGIGWMCWLTSVFAVAAVANGIAVYLGFFNPDWGAPLTAKAAAAAVILGTGAVNYYGVKQGAWTSNFFTAAKLIPLALFVLIGLPQIDLRLFDSFAPHGFRPLGAACFLAYFAFQGFEVVPVPAGEVDKPQRNIPLAVLGSLAFSAVLYMLVQAVAVGVFPGLAGSQRPLAQAASRVMGSAGAAMLAAGAAVSMIGFIAGSSLGTPRYLVALAQNGDLPPALAGLHPRFNTPHRAVALTTAFSLAAALLLDFNKLVDFANVVICAQYIAACAAVFLLKRKENPAGFFLSPWAALPIFAVAATLWLGAQGEPAQLIWSVLLLALGFCVRAVFRAVS